MDKSIAAGLANAGVKPARPSDAFGDPDRRRGMVSFLTWAFFLSEAFKGIEAEAAGLKATDAPDAASSAAASADGPAQDLPSDAASYNEWPISLPPDAIGKFPVAGHLPAIPEVSMGQPEEFNLARARFSEPPAYGGGGGHSGAHGGGHSTHDAAARIRGASCSSADRQSAGGCEPASRARRRAERQRFPGVLRRYVAGHPW